MIWYPPYYEDPDPEEEEAEEAAEYAQVMFEAAEEAAAKYSDHAINAHLPVSGGFHKRRISESNPKA